MNKNTPILVTGATGYVAGWIIERLLMLGYIVHATVRDPSKKENERNFRVHIARMGPLSFLSYTNNTYHYGSGGGNPFLIHWNEDTRAVSESSLRLITANEIRDIFPDFPRSFT